MPDFETTSVTMSRPARSASFRSVVASLITRWWRGGAGSPSRAPIGGATWDPIVPPENGAEREGFDRARLAERLMLLATLCRASYGGFAGAAQHANNNDQSEWLSGCARQRKSLASELRGIVLVLAEGDAIAPPWQRWVAQVAVDNTGTWGESWMGRCIRGEENLLRLYEQLFQSHLPSGMTALLRRQYDMVMGTVERLKAGTA